MRHLLAASAVLLALTIPVTAHATVFTFTAAGSAPITFTLNNPPDVVLNDSVFQLSAYNIIATNGDVIGVDIFGPAEDAVFSGGAYGHFDIEFFDYTAGVDDLEDGPTLFNGTVYSPFFIEGVYNLTGDPFSIPGVFSASPNATLSISPEPSSLVLLGTGVLSLAAASRRKLRKA